MIRVTDQQYWMHPTLKTNLDTMIYNVKRDFDAVGIISGSGMVRVGKTMLGTQIGYYCAHQLQTPFDDNVLFSGKNLRQIAHKLPRHSVIVDDESRAELSNKRIYEEISKNIMDFFAECGMYNHVYILILPDFFELNRGLALNRSDFLINVFRGTKQTTNELGEEVTEYTRGYFQFYNKARKKRLYIDGKKKYEDYSLGRPNFTGEFRNHWVINKEEYEKKKLEFLLRLKHNSGDEIKLRACLNLLKKEDSLRDISQGLESFGWKVSYARLSQILKGGVGLANAL